MEHTDDRAARVAEDFETSDRGWWASPRGCSATHGEAEDVVQQAWLRLDRARRSDADAIESLPAG